MLSRILNIFVIKQRTMVSTPPSATPSSSPEDTSSGSSTPSPNHHHRGLGHLGPRRLTEWLVSLGDGQATVKLRGTADDVRAVTADAWLRRKTAVEGYLEAAAKLIVFLVAAVSGNMTQAGAIVMMALLLTTAGLLALSNANAKAYRINGRTTSVCLAPSAGKEKKSGAKAVVVDGRAIPVPAQADGADLAEKGIGYSTENTAA